MRQRVAVFLDGDFWHGYRFGQWAGKLSKFWQDKIGKTLERDKRNFAKLKRMGWRVVRVWEHSVEKDLDGVVRRICEALR